MADGQAKAFLGLSAGLHPHLSILPWSPQPSLDVPHWGRTVTLRSSPFWKSVSLMTTNKQVAFQAAGRSLFQGTLSFHPFLGLALCGTWLSAVPWSLGKATQTQSTTEHPHDTPSTWHHFWPVSTSYPERLIAYLLSPSISMHLEASI